MPEDEDIRDAMMEDLRRGRTRRPVDTITVKKRKRVLQALRKALAERDERLFLEAIRAAGLKDGTPEFRDAVFVWRQFREKS